MRGCVDCEIIPSLAWVDFVEMGYDDLSLSNDKTLFQDTPRFFLSKTENNGNTS